MSEDKYYNISWDEFHKDVKELAKIIKDKDVKYNRLVAVARGGYLPAGILAYELNARDIESISVQTYDGENQRDKKDAKVVSYIDGDGEGCLIIDDLVDTGGTIKILKAKYPKATFASVYVKEKSKDIIDLYTRQTPSDKWIMFPWD
jgi:xanthine phosphoribosyltransferase